MQLAKAVLKAELAQHFGRKLEDIEDTTKRDLWKLEGGLDVLKQAAAAIDQHRPYYQDQCDEGVLDGPQTKVAMDVITRCVGGLQSLADKAQLAKSLKAGELQGVRRGIDLLQKEYEIELARVQAVQQMVEHDGRPDDGAAEDIRRRKTAAQEEKKSMAANKKSTKNA